MSVQDDTRLVGLQQTLYQSKNPTRRWLHTSRRDWIIAAVRKAAEGRAGSALEIGPGSGLYLPVLAERFREVVAADVEEAYLNHSRAVAERLPNVALLRDDITRSTLPDERFDLILCTEVVEHLADAQAAFAHLRRILRPGGALVLSTPQKWSVLEVAARVALLPIVIQMTRLVYREPVLETGHINLMTEGEVCAGLQCAGLRVIERHKSGLYLPLVAELAGESGLRVEQWLERKLRGGPLDFLLWTQYYVCEA